MIPKVTKSTFGNRPLVN